LALVQAEVARAPQLDVVVGEADCTQRGGQPEDEQSRRRRALSTEREPEEVGAQVACPDRGEDLRPPTVGVPRLRWWLFGASSRISWPNPNRVNTRINTRVSRSATARAMPAAMRICLIGRSDPKPPPGQYGRAAATHVIGKTVDTEDEHWNV
jgi:hypothetical protein